MGAITIMAWIQNVYPDSNLIIWGLVPSYIWNLVVIGQFLWTPFVLFIEKKITPSIIWRYFLYSVYNLTWVPIAVIGIMNKDKKEWFHTKHTRKISIREIQ